MYGRRASSYNIGPQCACCMEQLSSGLEARRRSCDDCQAQILLCKQRTAEFARTTCDPIIGPLDTLRTVLSRIMEQQIYEGFTDSFIICMLLQEDGKLGCEQNHIFNLESIKSLATNGQQRIIDQFITSVKDGGRYSREGINDKSLGLPGTRYNKLLWTTNFVRKNWVEENYKVFEQFKVFMQNIVSPPEIEEGEITEEQKDISEEERESVEPTELEGCESVQPTELEEGHEPTDLEEHNSGPSETKSHDDNDLSLYERMTAKKAAEILAQKTGQRLINTENVWTFADLKKALLTKKTHRFKKNCHQNTLAKMFFDPECKDVYKVFKTFLEQLVPNEVKNKANNSNSKVMWIYVGSLLTTIEK